MLPSYLGVLATPVPLPIVQRIAQRALGRVLAKHPEVIARIGPYASRAISVVPTDIPFEFNIQLSTQSVRVIRRGMRPPTFATRITGPLAVLMALVEGRLDGDAEFFGRKLTIEGDMETALALRNASESAGIDFVEDISSGWGPAKRQVRSALAALRRSMLAREGVVCS